MASSSDERELAVLIARDDLSITRASSAAGERITQRHVHHRHTDAFYVLEGELTFEVGHKTITVSAGGFVAVPPTVPHSFRNTGEAPARWLTIHTPDGGFAAFIRGVRDGVEIGWDVSAA